MRVETCAHSSRVTGRAEGVAHGHRGSSQARSVSLPATVLSCGLGEREMRSDVAGNVWRPLFYVIAQRIGSYSYKHVCDQLPSLSSHKHRGIHLTYLNKV